jgi:hypothetical protein
MISIVVPVVWGFEPFCDFLSRVVQLPVVGEVILINNAVSRTPEHSVLSHPKIKMYNQEENIYVNPAWNLGVSIAENDIVCILNDDVLVDLRVFFEANDFVSKNVGVLSIGMPTDIFKLHCGEPMENIVPRELITTGDIKITKPGEQEFNGHAGSGSLFFIHKENWIDIPDDFKIYWGDTWQSDLQSALGRTNYFINNCFYYSPWNMAAKIGVGSDYQQTKEFWDKEVFEYFKSVKIKKYIELNIPIPESLLSE